MEESPFLSSKRFISHQYCQRLKQNEDKCMESDNLEKDINKLLSQKKAYASKQAKFSVPISKTNPARVNLALREQRRSAIRRKTRRNAQ